MPAQWLGIREGLRANTVIARTRLFERLDSARTRRVLWVAGADGSGKSTLLASYVARRELKSLWLDLTPDDADPGWFLAHLGIRAGYSRQRGGDMSAQVRRQVAGLTRALPAGAVIVLDGVEQIPAESNFALVLREAIEVTPTGIQWCLLSGEPVNEDLAFLVEFFQGDRLGPEDLCVDENELESLLRKHANKVGVQAARSLAYARGAIGCVVAALALEGASAAPTVEATETPPIPDCYLEYAAAHLAELPEPRRNAFFALSLLHHFDAGVLEALVVDGASLETLHRWERRGLFIQRIAAGWRFHASFRTILNRLFTSQWDPVRRAEVYTVVARYCESRGRPAEAVEIWSAAEDWEAMATLIDREAESELSADWIVRLRRWIEALPDSVMERLPMMRYWLGRALAPVDDELARLCYLRAREQFERRPGLVGVALCQGGILEILLRREADAAELAQIVVAMDESLAGAGPFPSRAVELKCLSAYVRAALWTDTATGRLHDRVRRMHELLGAFEIQIDDRLRAASCLVEFAEISAHEELARTVAEFVQTEGLHSRGGAEARAQFVLGGGQRLLLPALKRESLDVAIADADAATSPSLSFQGRFLRAQLAIDESRHSDAQADLRVMQSLRREKSAADSAAIALLTARLAHAHLRHEEAVRQAVLTLQLAERALPRYALLRHGVQAIAVLLEHSAFDRIVHALDRLEKRAQHYFHGKWQYVLALLRADLAMCEGADGAMQTSIEIMLRCAPMADGVTLLPAFYGRRAGIILAYALEHGFGGAATAPWLRTVSLPAPAQSAAFWPWRARLQVLGSVGVARGEAAWRIVESLPPLLTQLVLAGVKGMDDKNLKIALYGRCTGPKVKLAFERDVAALHEVLGDERCIWRTGRRMGLDAGTCWVDLWAFDELADRDPSRAMALYAGKLLLGVEGDGVEHRRAELHQRYVRCVSGIGQQHELQGRHDIALAIFQAGLAIDGACESFFQGVMRCELALGNPARARQAYELLTTVLASHGGAVPSSLTERIFLGVQAPANNPSSDNGLAADSSEK